MNALRGKSLARRKPAARAAGLGIILLAVLPVIGLAGTAGPAAAEGAPAPVPTGITASPLGDSAWG